MPDVNRPDSFSAIFAEINRRLVNLERGGGGPLGLKAQTIRIVDENSVVRVWLGLLDDGTYGLKLWDAAGVLEFPSSGAPQLLGTFSFEGNLTTRTGHLRLYAEFDCILESVRVSVNTSPSGSPVVIDLLGNGATSIFSTGAPAIPPGQNTVKMLLPSTTTMAAGEYLIPQISSIGSGTPGADLTINVMARPN